MDIKSYKDLIVWKKAKELAIEIYKITCNFPKEEMFGITNQLRGAVVSISNNISEGTGRHYKKDTIQFLFVSNGSLNEVESMLQIAKLGFINEKQTDELVQRTEEVRKLLKGFIKYFQDSTILK
ncbi:MAG: four helix bundle protein [Chitinophagaceae bacterium]|nr:four helix bundle protein [Chitinophagaceae bacterium]